ncbi:hypothetical protein G6O69_22635 [Pseudenhygromyxa sp. WMMC2535]|uniref:hypothetical protein n=1 Tax=Pseudenhygromyxa sp. WMMC2535 TaxID=2712867 RepID=UPI001595EA8F|nr:hypothetical protein [Pseudenhygromyxa sp. WMMC2535]NVB40653.1 hypothetical protein [Pseudenhygromyxa sp. WMMC2535]
MRTANCRIDRCSCGAVHITVGGTTVRLREPAARELQAALTGAFAQIDGERRSTGAPTPAIHLVPPPKKDDELH